MKDLEGKIAVITGAGNGFGAEFAKTAARRGMKMVLADIDGADLDRTLKTVEGMGADASGVCADLSLYDGIREMTRTAMDKFGRIDLLINNAGIGFGGLIWEMPLRDWQWMLEINYYAQIRAMHEIIPIMLKQGSPAHVVNVASIAGLIVVNNMYSYHSTKHAVVVASESTQLDLQGADANVRLSVFCPGFVQTDLHNYERHRPPRFQAPDDPYYQSEAYKNRQASVAKSITGGFPIDPYGELVFKAIEDNQFYIVPHEAYMPLVALRGKNIVEGTNPDITKLA
jgi:NAD(P)-dependent dehydrogenase (short-subunit alcohol dehydrogenase family)